MTFATFPSALSPPACPLCAGEPHDPNSAAPLEQLRLCLHQLPSAAGDMVALGALGRQLCRSHAELDALLLQGTIDLRAAHLSLQALLTLLQRRDEPLLFSSEEALALLEPVQQRLQLGLQRINRVF